MGEGNFNEVLGFSFDVQGFQSALDDMIGRYTSFIEQLNTIGGGTRSPFGTGSSDSVLAGVSQQVTDLQSTFNVMFNALTEGFENVNTSARTVSQSAKLDPAVIEQNKRLLGEVVDTYIQGQNVLVQAGQRTAQQLAEIEEEKTARIKASVNQIAEAHNISDSAQIANMVKLATAQIEEGERATNANIKLIEKQALATQKAADQQIAIEQKRDVELATMRGRTLSEEDKLAAQRVAIEQRRDVETYAAAQKAEQEITAQLEAEEKQRANIVQKFVEARLKAQQQSALAEEKFQEQLLAQQEKDYQNALKVALKTQAERVKGEQEAAEQTQAIIQKLEESRVRAQARSAENEARFDAKQGLSGLVGSIPNAIAGILKFQAAMAALNVTLAVVKAPLDAISAVLSGGFAYDERLQTRSQDLQAVLLQSVTYSKNFSENIKLAGEDAGILVRQVDDLAIKLRTNSDTLKVGFQSFLEAGGRNLTRSNSEALQVSGLVTSGLQGLTKNPSLLNREEAQELSKLVEGTVKSGDKLEEIFGLTAAQINKIAKDAQTTKDLFDQLVANSPGLQERLKASGDNMQTLVSTLDLFGTRLEGLVVGPLFEQLVGVLKKILDYLHSHSQRLNDIATQIGKLIADFTELAIQAAKIGFPLAVATLKDLSLIAISVTSVLVDGVQRFSAGILAAKYALQGNLDLAKQLAQYSYNGTGPFANTPISSGLNNIANDINNIGKPGSPPSEPKSDPRYKPLAKPTNTNPDRQIVADFNTSLQKIKEDTQNFLDAQKEAFAQHNEDLDTYTENVVEYQQREKAAIIATGEEYAKKAEKSGAKNAKVDAQNIRTIAARQAAEVQKQINAEILKDVEDKEKAKQEQYKNTANLAIAYANAELDSLKRNGAGEVDIAEQVALVHEQEYKARISELISQRKYANTETDRARLDGQIATSIVQRSGQSDSDQYGIQVATLHEIAALDNEQIERTNVQLAFERQINNEHFANASYQKSALELQQNRLEIDRKVAEARHQAALAAEFELMVTKQLTPEDTKAVSAAERKVIAARALAAEADRTLSNDDPNVLKIIFNDDDVHKLQDVFTQGFATGVEDLTNAFGVFKNITDEYLRGFKQGGLLGGIGGVLSGQGGKLINSVGDALGAADDAGKLGGGLSSVSNLLSAASPFISAIGPAFQIIGDLFTAAAKRTAEEMKKNFAQIQQNLSNGTINLGQAIQQEQATINETISKLSSEKGGQGELDAILPQMQSALDALKQQQHQVFVTMDENVASLKLQTSYLQTAYSTWEQINKQVTDYVNAGGSIQEAQQFISESLQQQKKQAADDLIAAETQAVQDAQSYNSLLQQRTDLIKQYNEQAFGIKNKDSIERKQANAVTAASSLADLTSQYQQSLQSDNQQITQLGAKVDAEKQIFGIATDTASLQKESNSLALQSLKEQVQQWQSIQALYNGIVQSSSGLYTYTQALANLLGYSYTFGNDPNETYTGYNNITGYSGAGTGTSTPIGVGYSAGGVGHTAMSSGYSLGQFAGSFGTGGAGAFGGFTQMGNAVGGALSIGDITVTINNSSGGTIDAASIANDLQSAIISRNQYAGSSYY